MHQPLPLNSLADRSAAAIFKAFDTHQRRFLEITRRAQDHFECRDWLGMQADATARLELYRAAVDQIEQQIRKLLADRLHEKRTWTGMKAAFSALVVRRDDWEVAETFFNSVTRRIFATVGVDPQIEFVHPHFISPPMPADAAVYRSYVNPDSTVRLIRNILADFKFKVPFQDPKGDAALAAVKIERHLEAIGALRQPERVEMIKQPFFRNMGAFLVGRMFSGTHRVPLVFALVNTPAGIRVDALLLQEDAVSILFSFARSYFHVAVERPYDLVQFIKTIVPRKRLAELYISTGYSKHGKTELYRDLMLQMNTCCQEQFDISRGKPGMVMIVFNMPNDDLVFKLIRERFAQPKKTTRKEVMQKYDLVFKHDRAGRLVDAQAFEHLRFNDCCFAAGLVREFQAYAGQTVQLQNSQVIIQHAYLERRVIPLDVYVQEAEAQAARAAVLDFGRAIKDMARSNIFPGDMLLKNFGVTRHGRVVFYDYDEICALTSCNFRRMPRAHRYEDDLAAEPWFYVDENDVFPEEFEKFLGLPPALHDIFMDQHADLFQVDFWQTVQTKLRKGRLMYIYPYTPDQRLRSEPALLADG